VQVVKLPAGARVEIDAVAGDRMTAFGQAAFDDPPGLDARGAGVDVTHRTALDRLHALDVRLPYLEVRLLAWETLCPKPGALPQIAHLAMDSSVSGKPIFYHGRP